MSEGHGMRIPWRFQKSAEAIVLHALHHWWQEGPNRGEQGGVTDELGSRNLLRPEMPGAHRPADLEHVSLARLRSRACSSSRNRLVRTRLLGGVGAGTGNRPRLPDFVGRRRSQVRVRV